MSLLAHPRFMAGAELHKAGRFEEAGRIYQELIEENPNDPDLWHFKGLLAAHQGRFDEAVRFTTLAIALKPGMPDYFQTLAMAQEALGQPIKAAEAYNKLGNALQEQCRFAEALPPYTRSAELDPAFVSVTINRGAALDRLGRYDEAAEDFTAALARLGDADEPARLMDRANALSGLGRVEEAIAVYSQVIAVEPENATAHCSRALLRLRLGEMAEGWKEYEWRWNRNGGFKEPRGQFHQPVWQGESPEQLGGTLLVIAEQGLGDIIQFARYLPLLKARGYDVLFETLPALTALFVEGLPGIRVIPRIDDPLEVEGNLPFTAWAGIMSLPERFGTALESVPAEVPYLAVAAKKVEAWRERLKPLPHGRGRETYGEAVSRTGEGVSQPDSLAQTPSPAFLSHSAKESASPMRERKKLRVGLVWAGNPKNLNDFARSIPAPMLTPILKIPDIRFYSLQKGTGEDHDFSPYRVKSLSHDLTDFTQTAAAIVALDLVITVDTSVCHMAGALGRPVWLMIPTVPDWRWLNEGDTTPWYPTMRIFRQTVRGQWQDVIEAVAKELKQLAGAD